MCATAQMCAAAELAVRQAYAAGKTCDEAAAAAIEAAAGHEPALITPEFRRLLMAHARHVYQEATVVVQSAAH
ncbi:MAG: hypothetical protein INF43_04940 [Alphaproteobacteria bacterium]|nr:hypothetical protein [Alphaproteobacteria bacterium]